jgi:hypothetical protein
LRAHFDGKVLIPDEPTGLEPGAQVRVTIEPIDQIEPTAQTPRLPFQPLNIRIPPELSNAIALDPEFGLQDS